MKYGSCVLELDGAFGYFVGIQRVFHNQYQDIYFICMNKF